MMKLTRDQLFVKSFADFMETVCDQNFQNLREWKLENITKNKKSQIHEYEFTVSQKYISYVIDKGRFQEQVFSEQEIPDFKQFSDLFSNYLAGHSLEIDGTKLSYVDVSQNTLNNYDGLSIRINIKYHKSHYPFPIEHTSVGDILENNTILEKINLDFEKKNEVLKKKLREKNRMIEELYEQIEEKSFAISYKNQRIDILEDEIRTSNIRAYNNMNRMEKVFCELYKKLPEDAKEDCPVCLNKMSADSLTVPNCYHFICIECYDKCNSCPICRDKFI